MSCWYDARPPQGNIHAFDLRMMIGLGPGGFFPVAIYTRISGVTC